MRNDTRRTFAQTMRSFVAFLLAVCLLVGMVPAALAAKSVGNKSGKLSPSSTKVYVKLSQAVSFFTGETTGKGAVVSVPAGTVCQLYSDNWYTSDDDSKEYYSVYYNNKRYNVLRDDVKDDVMTAEELETYVTGTMWKQTTYGTLRKRDGLVGDIRVYAVQLALRKLGYYTGALDGEYGNDTSAAVRKFQSDNNLGRDGSAGPLTQPVLFAKAMGGSVSTGSTGSSTTVSSSTSGTLRTNSQVALRKYGSVGSTRLTYVPKNVNLAYSDTYRKNNVTWYRVRYNSKTGWIMGTYVTVTSGGGSGTTGSVSSSAIAIGKVTITMPGTRVRVTANGQKSGTVLAKGTVVDLLAQPVSAGGYTWYNIRTKTGQVGFVRGDCSTASIGSTSSGSGSGSIQASADKTFVKLPAETLLFETETKPSSGGKKVAANTVLMMYSTTTYTKDGTEYCSLYFNNKKYNAVYSEISSGIMKLEDVSAHLNSLLNGSLSGSLKRELDLVGDVRVYALQTALKLLGYYTGKLDGDYGSGTQSAVRNFQRAAKITVDGDCGNETWSKLRSMVSGSIGGGSAGAGTTITDFGTVTKIQKASWNFGEGGADIFPRDTYATVLDCGTGKVFRIYRWAGARHADCVPATAADTKVMCEIVGFPYNDNHPSSTQVQQIINDNDNGHATYTWPDFNNTWGGAKDIGGDWDRRPALLKVDGSTVAYPVSIYGYPHGYEGTGDSFGKATYNSGENKNKKFITSNYYGMMCVHFVGSLIHTESVTTPDPKHQEKIQNAYDWAKNKYPSLFN